MQLRELREYCRHRGWKITEEYVDSGWSGAKASRPQLDRLMKDARKRRFDAVLVWKLDRWGRSLMQSLQSVQELASRASDSSRSRRTSTLTNPIQCPLYAAYFR